MKNNFIFTSLILISLFSLIFIISLIPLTQAAVGVGASPASLHFDNMLRDGYAEGYITVSVGSDEFVSVSATPKGDIAEWMDFPEGPYSQINKNNLKKFKIIIRPPSDVANGVYKGTIRFTTSPLGTISSGAGSAIQVSIDVVITVTITDLQFLRCKASSFEIRDTEQGQPILFITNVRNEGNVKIKPGVDITIWNQRQDKIVNTFNLNSNEEILPTTSKSIFFNMPSTNLGLSQYWASITVKPCQDNKLLTFDVVEPGTLSSDGILKTIITKIWAEPNEIVPIVAVFQNFGEFPVKAIFKGNVQESGRILQIIESGEKTVNVGEEANLTTFFTPKSPGRYIVKGRVYYGSKQTYENTGIINVQGTKINTFMVILYSLIVILLIFIIYKLYKRKMRMY